MKPLTNYLKNNVFNNIDESLNNNVRMINESQLIIEHGKDIDNLLHKFGSYTYNSLYNPINESSFNYKLTLNESITARDFFIFICEDYKEALLEELNIYEQYINDALEISEGFKNSKIYQNVVNVLKQGKEKTLQAYDNVKTKIKEVNQIIKDFANKTIKSVKEMANRLMELLEKFNCTIKQLFEKMGFNVKDEEIDTIGQDLAKNPETLSKNDIYDFKSKANESFEYYGQQLITEDEESKNQEDTENTSKVVKQADKKGVKQMLWEGFKQFLIWASVCVVIPGIVCAVFPGTFIALLVPLACKLSWNGYKIVKLWKQWQKIRKEWDTYKKSQKWITVIGIIASIIALAFNFNSLIGDGGKILSEFSKTGCDLLSKANLGIQPDVLTRGFAAFTKMISEGKFSFDDFSSSFKEITDSFAQHINYDKVVKSVEYIGKSAKEISDNLPSKPFDTSMKALNWLKEQGVDPSKVKPNGKYTVFLNGHSDASWFKVIEKTVGKIDHNDIVNGPLKKICTKAGSIVQTELTGEQIQKLIKSGIDLGYQNKFSIIGGTFEKIATVSSEIVKAASSMLTTIPSVEYAFQNNGGFQVRLGTDKKKFIYEVGKDGVKKEEAADHIKEVEKITNIIKETNNKYYKELKDKLKEEDGDKKKEIEEKLKTFQKNFEKINNRSDVIIFYGNKVENQNESLKSLHDYLLFESEDKKSEESKEITIKDIKDNFDDLRKFLFEKIGKDYDEPLDNGKHDYIGNIQILLRSFFSLNDKEYNKWDYDPDFKQDPYESVKKRLKDNNTKNDKFGKQDIEQLAVCYTIWNEIDNDDTYNSFCEVFKKILILRKLLKESNELNDNIKGVYIEMVNNLKNIDTIDNDYIDGKEWTPNENWAPIKFNEDNVSDKTKEAIENTEKKNFDDVENKLKKAEQDLKGEDAVIPDEEDKKSEEDKKHEEDNNKDSNQKENDKENPILMITYNYVIDLSDSDNNGPRKDIFTLKGISDNYEFIEIKGGTSKENLSIMLGDILKTQTEYLRGFTILNPCDDKDNDKYKTIGNENIKREDFGSLTNEEITDILNNPKSAKDYIFNGSSSIIQSEDDKKYEEDKKKEYDEKLKNADEETINVVKEIDPDAVGEDGKIKPEKIEDISKKASSYKLAQHRSENTKKNSGFWSKLKNFVKGLFGRNKKEGKKYNKLLNHIDPETNESLNKYDNLDLFLEEMFKQKTLAEYIMERKL